MWMITRKSFCLSLILFPFPSLCLPLFGMTDKRTRLLCGHRVFFLRHEMKSLSLPLLCVDILSRFAVS